MTSKVTNLMVCARQKNPVSFRGAHGNLREIAANGEIGYTKLVKKEAIWPWFEGRKVKDQGELWS